MTDKKDTIIQTVDKAQEQITRLRQEGVEYYSSGYDMEFSYIGNTLRKAEELFMNDLAEKCQVSFSSRLSLADKSDTFYAEGILKRREREILNEIRQIGNTAVHAERNNSAFPDLQTLLKYSDDLLQIVEEVNYRKLPKGFEPTYGKYAKANIKDAIFMMLSPLGKFVKVELSVAFLFFVFCIICTIIGLIIKLLGMIF